VIREELNQARIAVTGATGFLGTALVERLLRAAPECELVLIVRPGRRGAQHRVDRDILRNDAFDRLRAEVAATNTESFEEMCARRVFAVAGDVGTDGLGLDHDGLALLATCDLAIHSAATVSFDSALDDAVEVNLLGPTRVAQALQAAAAIRTEPTKGGRPPGEPAHLVAVSTCYVAGSRRGRAPEQLVDESPFFVDVDWRAEVDNARRARVDNEQASRTPARLAELSKEAHRQLGAAGTPALSDKIEQLRQRWVSRQMTDAGRARASSLGFPDAYAFTKALGERALGETRGDVPVSIVRPSIIESALAEPVPGWIRGFRMAEPVIAAYARGMLVEFPGVPEGTIDVIPVDLVVATILAVAARGPEFDDEGTHTPDVVQIASGGANPLKYGQLVDLVQAWFTERPVYDEYNQPISIPDWSFPGRGRVAKQLGRARKTLDLGERVLDALPLRGSQAEIGAELEERKEQLERASGYVELYGAYAECEAIYQLDRLYALWGSLDDDDRRDFMMDPVAVDWPTYINEIQLPSTVKQARLKMAPGRKVSVGRADRIRKNVLSPDRQLAVFDLENTLIASNVVASYTWLATRRLDTPDRIRFAAQTIREAPRLLSLDRADRSDFLRYFYRRFDRASVAQLDQDALEMMSDLLITKSFPDGIRRVREHRRLGHRTLLITGALDLVVAPLRPLFDDIVAAEMTTADGSYTGRLRGVPPTGEARYQVLVDYADEHGLDLRESVAYADSSSDLPMLEAVGFPVAVNAETKLASIARKRGWLIEHWSKSAGAPNRVVPIGPRTHRGPLRNRRATSTNRGSHAR
jgi:HAD superfamily hydrolase (TIGR01490 family)